MDFLFRHFTQSLNLLYLVVLFSIVSMAFILFTLLIRVYHIIQHRRDKQLEEKFSRLLFEYLDDPENAALLNSMFSFQSREDFFGFLLNYLQILKGKDYQSILRLIKALNIPDLLLRHLKKGNRWKRAYAAYYLGILVSESALPHLFKALRDKFYLVRFHAAQSIIQLKQPETTHLAIGALFDIPYLSSYQIMEALTELDENGLKICLDYFRQESRADQEKQLLFVDLFSYKKFTEASEDIVRTLREAENRELRIGCIRALGLLNYTPAVPLLREQLNDPDWVICSQVLRALGRIGDIGSLADFKANLKSENFWVRYNAALALYDLGMVGQEYIRKITRDPEHPGQEIVSQVILEKKTNF